jgi:hypothetical protein
MTLPNPLLGLVAALLIVLVILTGALLLNQEAMAERQAAADALAVEEIRSMQRMIDARGREIALAITGLEVRPCR